MKIFYFSGSPKGKNSRSYQYVEKLLRSIENNFGENKVTIHEYNPKSLNLKKSSGDESLFINGEDSLDCIDKFDSVKKEIQESDLIILSSPVMAQAVSADMKIFIERISHFAHTFSLIGKTCYIVTSSYSNGNSAVHDYLHDVVEYMGMIEVGRADIVISRKENIDFIKEAAILSLFLRKKIIPKIPQDMNEKFDKMRSLYFDNRENPRFKYEAQIYERKGYFSSRSFGELYTDYFYGRLKW